MTLPSPGPGRPHHPSHGEPSNGCTIAELVFWVVALPALVLLVELLS